MKTVSNTTVLEGKLVEYPYRSFDDEDNGWYVDSDKVTSNLWEFKNRWVRITIQEIDEPDN